MGNQIEKLKKKYENKDFNVLNEKEDKLLGNFAILSFFISKPIVCIKKSFNPKNYNIYIDVEYLIKLISNSHRNISNFFFMDFDQKNENSSTLIFEYGSIIKQQLKEKKIWILIEDILEGMIFLEKNLLHYPILKLKYILEKKGESYKLINPYVFPQFLEKVIKIYANPMMTISQKKEFNKKEIKRNVKELGILVLSLMGNFENDRLYSDFNYRKNCLKLIFNNISPQLQEFFSFIFDERISPDRFSSFKEWLNNNKKRFNPILMKDFYLKSDNKNIGNNFRNFHNRNKVNNNRVRASSTNVDPRKKNNIDYIKKISLKNSNNRINIFENQRKEIKNGPMNNSLNFTKGGLVKKGINHFPKTKNDREEKSHIFNKNFINKLGREELKENNQIFVGGKEDVYNFINGGGNQNNMNNYIKNQNKFNLPVYKNNQNQISSNNNKNTNFTNYDFNKNKNSILINKESNFPKPIKNKYSNYNSNERNQNINYNSNETNQKLFQNLKNKNTNQNFNNINSIKNPDQNQKNNFNQKNTDQNFNSKNIYNFPNQNNPQKKEEKGYINAKQIKSIIMRWDKETKKYVKTTYFTDGSSDKQIIENDIRLKKNEKDLRSSLNLKKNVNERNILEDKKINTFYFILEQEGKKILLFKRKNDKSKNKYHDLKKIVDFNKLLMPSVYHHIENDLKKEDLENKKVILKKNEVDKLNLKKKVKNSSKKKELKKKDTKKKLKKKDSDKKFKNGKKKNDKKIKNKEVIKKKLLKKKEPKNLKKDSKNNKAVKKKK